jgi:hypothetical protein
MERDEIMVTVTALLGVASPADSGAPRREKDYLARRKVALAREKIGCAGVS